MAKLLISIVVLGLVSQSFGRIPTVLKVWPARIVGGEPANPGEFPYQLSLRYRGSFICGASILNANTIITAAHCAVGSPRDFSIVAGDHNRNVNEGTEQERSVSRVTVHEDYDDWIISNDIALMTLSEPLELNENVQAIALPSSGQASSGDAVVTGWGTTSEGGSVALILQKVTVPIITDEECRDAYGEDEILDSMLCAGAPGGGRDACQGDSGGPLAVGSGSDRVLAGIVSWGYGCARPNYPGVYTEVSAFIDWINRSL